MPGKIDTLLFAVQNNLAKAGLPPKDYMDSFGSRSAIVGKLPDVSKIAFNPEGELYAIRGSELYTGPMPSSGNQDWFSSAKRVGKVDWDKMKSLFFDRKGLLYAVTKDGAFYKGQAPSNENVSWLYGQATQIGKSGWNNLAALFFDLKDNLYAVTDKGKLVMRSPPTSADEEWLASSTTIGTEGWYDLTHFMDVSPDGNLWCVDTKNGKIYKGAIPVKGDAEYLAKAENLGIGYNIFPCLAFTTDKTIQSIVSLEFLPDSGKVLSHGVEVVQSQVYNNKKSGTPLKHKFTVSKTMTETSTFTREHGFTVAMGMELTFKTGVPVIAEGEAKISIDMSTTHTWSFSKTNETQTTFSSSSDVEVPPWKGIRMVASVSKGEMDVPYRAQIRTLFGYTTTIQGMWKGVTHYDLMVTQEDYSG
ncbi:uncharacterized protein RCH25_000182 isoform 1-T1 [Pelodytes ibericus]